MSLNLFARDGSSGNKITADDHSAYVLITEIFMLVVVSVFMCIRLVVRWPWNQLFGYDDALTVLATFASLAQGIAYFFSVHYGLGRHIWALSVDELIAGAKSLYAMNVLGALPVCLSQLGVGILILRLAHVDTPRLTNGRVVIATTYIVLALIVSSLIASVIALAVPLEPGPAWMSASATKRVDIWVALEVVSFCIDVSLVTIPTLLIWPLQMRTKRKVTIIGGFSLRILTHICSIFRILALYDGLSDVDYSFALVTTSVWASIEINLIISVATIPCLASFLNTFNTGFMATNALHGMPGASVIKETHFTTTQLSRHSAGSGTRKTKGGASASAEERDWWDTELNTLRLDGPSYKTHVQRDAGRDDVSRTSFGSGQIMITKKTEVTEVRCDSL